MALFEGKTPAERNKTIAAVGLGAVALFVIVYNFGLFGGSSSGTRNSSNRPRPRATATPIVVNRTDPQFDEIQILRPVVLSQTTPAVTAAGRNIFAFYARPVKPAGAPPALGTAPAMPAAPSPTPPPPLLLTSINPGSVYARTGEFTINVTGDKFTPQTRVYVDNQEVATRFVSAQQFSAVIPAALVAAPGARQLMVRTPDGQLYSNTATLNIMAPPAPPYTYIGILGSPRYSDKAILKDQKGELSTVQLNDLVGGRFRVTGISERAVEFTDQQLKIKHSLPFIETGRTSSSSYTAPEIRPVRQRPSAPPRPPGNPEDEEDDEDDGENDDDEP